MKRNTQQSLGDSVENFDDKTGIIGQSGYASEVFRNDLPYHEEVENSIPDLKTFVDDGIASGIVSKFDPKEHLAILKAASRQ